MQGVTEWAGTAVADDRPGEQALLARARMGDSAAMEDLLRSHERALFSLCCGVLGNRADAEDAVQEAFFRALRALHRFRADSGFRTWLYRIALNVCLEWKRARQTAQPLFDSIAFTRSPESDAIQALRLNEALRSLLPRYRAIWLLKELEGWSVAEIAKAMRCSDKRIQNELYKARKMLAVWREREDRGV